MHKRTTGGIMSPTAGIIDDLEQELGKIVLPDVEFPTVAPDSLESVVQVVNWCREHSWRMLIAGRGHTFSEEHHVPDGVLTALTLQRKRMSEANPIDLAIEVEAGVSVDVVQEVVEQAGLMLERWPEDYPGTVGGLLCGSRGTKFRGILLGSTFVDGTGRVLNLGGAIRKDVSGFDGSSVLLGSRGTMAWLDRVVLRLKPKSAILVERVSLPPSTQAKEFSGLHRQIAAAFDPDDVFFKPKG